MASPVITVSPDMQITECAAKMKEFRIHHLPVADEKGNIIGMIAAMDLLLVAKPWAPDLRNAACANNHT